MLAGINIDIEKPSTITIENCIPIVLIELPGEIRTQSVFMKDNINFETNEIYSYIRKDDLTGSGTIYVYLALKKGSYDSEGRVSNVISVYAQFE